MSEPRTEAGRVLLDHLRTEHPRARLGENAWDVPIRAIEDEERERIAAALERDQQNHDADLRDMLRHTFAAITDTGEEAAFVSEDPRIAEAMAHPPLTLPTPEAVRPLSAEELPEWLVKALVVGVYPRSTPEYTERSDYQNGWNAAVTEVVERVEAAYAARTPGEEVLVRRDSGGVFRDGTTNTPPIAIGSDTTDTAARSPDPDAHGMVVVGYSAGSFQRECRCGRTWPCPTDTPKSCPRCGRWNSHDHDTKEGN